jgi:DNA repair exonuclease SbcCD ATPase subunit
LEDKDNLQKEAKQLIEEIHNTKNSEKDFSQKFLNLKTEMQEIKNINYSTHAILKTFCLKFYSYGKDKDFNKNNLLTKKFKENMQEFFEYFNNFNNQIQIQNSNQNHNPNLNLNSNFDTKNKEKNFMSTINFMENCTRAICAEMEICFEKLRETSEENKDTLTRLKSLEQNYQNLTLNSDEKTANERKLNQNLYELKEENKNLLDDVRNLESQCERLVNDFKGVRADFKNKIEENGDLKHEIRENVSTIGKLTAQLKEKDSNNNYLNYQILALEDYVKIISKEKKNLEGLVGKISKCLPVKEMQKAINEVLCVFDSLGQMERDRAKLEQNLKNLENQIANNSSNTASNYEGILAIFILVIF